MHMSMHMRLTGMRRHKRAAFTATGGTSGTCVYSSSHRLIHHDYLYRRPGSMALERSPMVSILKDLICTDRNAVTYQS